MAYVPPALRKKAAAATPVTSAAAGPDERRWERPPSREQRPSRELRPSPDGRCRCHEKWQLFRPAGALSHALNAASCDGSSLLGSAHQFCAAFYHLESTPEAEQPALCLAGEAGCEACPRKTVCCVARLVDAAGAEVFTGRYHNCYRGHGTTNLHAERFLTSDAALDRALCALPRGGSALELYLTYQPCHNSGGHERSTMGTEYTSCTELLLE